MTMVTVMVVGGREEEDRKARLNTVQLDTRRRFVDELCGQSHERICRWVCKRTEQSCTDAHT